MNGSVEHLCIPEHVQLQLKLKEIDYTSYVDIDISNIYWDYGVEGTGSGTLTWEPYFTSPVAGVGPR